ncbi:MAG: hypothetical protein IOC82_16525 [Aestuariivirga sp.]|nr:hypothetical protein [Aestuariivirga sp.]
MMRWLFRRFGLSLAVCRMFRAIRLMKAVFAGALSLRALEASSKRRTEHPLEIALDLPMRPDSGEAFTWAEQARTEIFAHQRFGRAG